MMMMIFVSARLVGWLVGPALSPVQADKWIMPLSFILEEVLVNKRENQSSDESTRTSQL
jgi:hypothetical protein